MFNNNNDEVLLRKVSEKKPKLYVIFKSKSSFKISK